LLEIDNVITLAVDDSQSIASGGENPNAK